MGPLPAVVTSSSGRLTMRLWTEADEPALSSAITASIEHLRPWMAWITDEPVPADQRLSKIASWRDSFGTGREAAYGMFLRDGAAAEVVAGGCGLHRRHPTRDDVLEIGYWVHADYVGRGVATEAAAALTAAAFEVDGVTVVEIHHQADNTASGRIPVKLGFTHQGDRLTEGRTVTGEPLVESAWSITADEFAAR